MNYFRNMPLTNKIITVGLLPGLLAVLFVNIGFFSGMYEIEQDVVSVERLDAEILSDFNELVSILEHSYAERLPELNDNFKMMTNKISHSLQEYEEISNSAEAADAKMFMRMKEILNKLINLHNEMQSSNHDRADYIDKIETVEHEIHNWYISSQSLITGERQNELHNLTYIIISASLLSVLFALFLSLRFSRYVKGPIKNLYECSEKLGSGNLDVRVQIDSDDEFGKLGQAFNNMAADLKKSVAAQKKEEREHQKTEEEKTKLLELVENKQKLESIGTLAGGIAHDFNNILTSILGNLSLARMQNDSGSREELNSRLEASEKATMRAKGLTNQLLTFSKGGEPVKTVISLNELISESCDFVLHGSNVRCNFHIDDNLFLVEADGGQINQVLNNLVINAAHAMPDGGLINISAENFLINPECELPLTDGNYLLIRVEDQGIGIRDEHLKQIFDPYFTTKHEGHGLGLASAYSIIRKHGGLLTVDSKVGEGAVFNIYLPASTQIKAGHAPVEERVHPGKGSILLMDDEKNVRHIGKDILNHLGYEVTTAEDGVQAVELYSKGLQGKSRFDLVILDLTIPGGMGGEKTFEKLRQLDPSVKVVVSSGYSQDPIMANYEQLGFSGVMPKPYKIEDVSRIILDIMHAG